MPPEKTIATPLKISPLPHARRFFYCFFVYSASKVVIIVEFQLAGYNERLTRATGQGDLAMPPTKNARTVAGW
jgi:hypothetical protein